MSARAVRFLIFLGALLMAATPALARDARTIVTTEGADYFGFDLRTEKNVTLEECKSACLGDPQCRAFTYNSSASWCFLKSDYSLLNTFPGAVAGKVVTLSREEDIGAPPALAFFPEGLRDEARRVRQQVAGNTLPADLGIGFLTASAENAYAAGNAREARDYWRRSLAIDSEDYRSWLGLSRAAIAIEPANYQETSEFQRDATAGAWNGYRLTRTTSARAEALAVMAAALERRELWRPALTAYEESLALVRDAQVQAEYADLKARKGFRVIDNTIDADSASPRACIQFSEDLVSSGVDYSSFVTVDGRAPAAIEAKDRQICVEDLNHGTEYRMALRSGLPAAIGEVIESPVVLNVYVRDRAPTVRFTGDNFVLPSTMRRGIPVVSINTDTVEIGVFRVGERALATLLSGNEFLRQLDTYDIGSIRDDLGEPVWTGELAVDSALNEETITSFPLDEALPEREPGVYVMTAEPEGDRTEDWTARATQWFLVSDIGLSTFAGQDGLHVFVRSLASAEPMAGVELTLLARNNEILGTATTNADGSATFTAGLARGPAGLAPAAMTAKQEGDFVFLDMTQAGFDLSDRGVAGREAPGAFDVFAWTERGIYRAGQTVHAAALSRDDAANAVENLPLTFIFYRPDGVEDRRLVSDGRSMGGHAIDLDLQANAMRGTWQMRIFTDPDASPVAEASFLVEDFVPDRIEFDLSSDTGEIRPGGTAAVTVDGRYLYGAPAAGLSIEGEVEISATREWARFPGYRFGLSDEEDEDISTRLPLAGLPDLDESGQATFDVSLDTLPATTRLLNAEVVVRMRESGGRAVERSLDLPVAPEGDMIGVRPEFSGDEIPENSQARFRAIAVDAAGERIAFEDARWSLVKIERQYQWYREGNSWNYEPVTFTTQVADGTVDLTADNEAQLSLPVEWGRYRLQIETDDPLGPVTSVDFDAGWFVEATSTETPDGLEVGLDKESYAPGEVARLNISPRFAGELLVTVGAERLLTTVTAHVPEDGATIDIPVSADWGAGAYVTATLYRPGEAEETRMPARAIGIKWLGIDPGDRGLKVSLDTPEKTEPRGRLSVPVSVANTAEETAYVIVAAVDVGILNLTRYEPPDPEEWYFGQRRLGIEIRDLYGRLIDGSAGVIGRIRTGGDGGSMAIEGSPPTEELVAFFSGPVRLDAQGKADVGFDLPQFNGTVRVMAVAWTKTGVGHAVSDVIVRDPVVLTAGLPRFLAPGDSAEVSLDIANTDGPAGSYTLEVDTDEEVSAGDVSGTFDLAEGEKTTVTIPISAQETGNAELTIRIAHADGLEVEQALSLPVRPAAMPITERHVVSLAANGGSLTIDRELLADSLLGGASVSVGVSPIAALDVPSLLVSLDRYPYGCAEQTTSRALPLLYVSELSEVAGLDPDPALQKRVQDAIYRVLSYQSSSGSFGLWGPGYGDLWLDAYVSDFLTRAREKNYDVPDEAMRQALLNLENSLAYDTDIASRGNEIAYALYVLARNRKASIGDLRYYADTQLDAFASPMARAQLAAGLALYGDMHRAERAFASALGRAQEPNRNLARGDYGSALRDGAAMLALAAETRPEPALVPRMVDLVVSSQADARRLSTQEEAWLLLAARAIAGGGQDIALEVDGTAHEGPFAKRMSGEKLLGDPLTVANRGGTPVDAVITTVAAPADPPPAGGDGFTIERTYFNLDGEPANVTEARQNERFVAVLTVTEENAWPSRVLVTDLLPAGFRIDNPRLVGSAELANFQWLGQTEAAHTEFRDDRFVAAFDRTADSAREMTFAYVVRAVTPGTYAHPAAQVEDMYRPYLSARTATGAMRVESAR